MPQFMLPASPATRSSSTSRSSPALDFSGSKRPSRPLVLSFVTGGNTYSLHCELFTLHFPGKSRENEKVKVVVGLFLHHDLDKVATKMVEAEKVNLKPRLLLNYMSRFK